ncbi:uncharacterized protein LOC126787097 isoform X2 [Argentina anserina]|uniref:uncharacterized protein LOC126787097 isoform X2 n=1 Tax=Argentina anserina TaxID=57926 RepID=UPI0021769283|nr:uncharacterized protein LOC126787097 isoform X2 [Potentilla anserina]XP_050369000.1 uncharacterized protein LOC126787097 isoform X2 [Potentilla anserina]
MLGKNHLTIQNPTSIIHVLPKTIFQKISQNIKDQNMPQDGLKSAVYRSFITCEDPKGVVDCGMIMRRSKSSGGSQIMDKQKKVEIRRNSKNSSTRSSSLELISPEKFRNSSSSSSFQIMEVSRGAQRLNHMIDSWSNEKNRFDHGQSKDIAKDLLKGALDLQESLVMLGKLQEASQYLSNLNKKHLGNPQRAYSNRHGDQDYVKPRLSSDGYIYRNSNEELKKVIRDSLVRQKLLEDTSTAEKGSAYSPQRYRESYAANSPSTSSSQSTMYHNTSEYSSVSSQKAKRPSLIAKLMGIEEYPLNSLQESEKISNPQRPSFEIDRPKVRKPQTASQSVDPEKRTLKEVLDTMRFKGLLRNNSFEEPKFDINHFNLLELEKRFTSDSPPIVLIKPISAESPETEAKAPIVRGEEAFYNRRMVKKLRSQGEVSPRTMIAKEGALKSDKVKQKLEVEETPSRKTSKEGGARNHRGDVDKHGEKEAKMKEMVARQLKASQPVVKKPQKEESIDKRVGKIQNVAADNRKSAAKDIVKAKTVSKTKSQDQGIVTSAKARKPESGSNIIKSRVSRQPSNVISTSSKCSTAQNAERTSTESRRNQLRKEKPIKEPTGESITKNVVSEEIIRRTVIYDTSESSLISFNTDSAVHLSKEEEKETYGCQSEGRCISFQSSLSEPTSLSSMQETKPESAEVTEEEACQSGKNGKTVGSSENLREILLNNASFFSHAEEFLDLDVNDSIIFQPPGVSNFSNSGVCRTRLALDCASELVECKSFQLSQTVSPLSLTLQGKLRVGLSVDKLVADVCNDMENLRSYSKLAGENLLADSLYSMLERDVMCKGVGKGTWDLAWRNGFTGDEAEQVVSDIERLIFNALIEEVFA